jgi:hypothetical protein
MVVNRRSAISYLFIVFATPKSFLPNCQSAIKNKKAVSPPYVFSFKGGFLDACLNKALKYLSCPGFLFFTMPLNA